VLPFSRSLFDLKKLDKLDNYFDKVIDADVFLKLENTSAPENKICEIKVAVPGNDLVVKKQSNTFEEATDMCVEALKKMLSKTKEKMKMN
jgi:putative sigma-54 modulation protein